MEFRKRRGSASPRPRLGQNEADAPPQSTDRTPRRDPRRGATLRCATAPRARPCGPSLRPPGWNRRPCSTTSAGLPRSSANSSLRRATALSRASKRAVAGPKPRPHASGGHRGRQHGRPRERRLAHPLRVLAHRAARRALNDADHVLDRREVAIYGHPRRRGRLRRLPPALESPRLRGRWWPSRTGS